MGGGEGGEGRESSLLPSVRETETERQRDRDRQRQTETDRQAGRGQEGLARQVADAQTALRHSREQEQRLEAQLDSEM